MHFLPNLLTNHHAGFFQHMRSTPKFRSILHADWSVSLGENRHDQRSQTFGGHAVHSHIHVDTTKRRIKMFAVG